MNYPVYRIHCELITPMLGTVPLDKELYTNYIAAKKAELMPDELNDELETINEEARMTGFHTLEDGAPFLYDYLIKGFLKEACSSMREVTGSESKKLKAYKKRIDGMVFVYPRRIPLDLHGQELSVLERPLRADTPQGPRVALASSVVAPEGTTLDFTITVLDLKVISEELIREWFDYGQFKALGQWRSGSYGRIEYTMEREN